MTHDVPPAGAGRPLLRHGAVTDVGLVREGNEDSWLATPPVFAVADGMGGHSGGDVASRIAVEELARLADGVPSGERGADALSTAFARAQARIVAYADAHRVTQPGWHAGTTAVVALLTEEDGRHVWLLANLGDSRIYHHGADGLAQVSVDHSVVQQLVDAGHITTAQAARHPERNVITRALGSPAGAAPDLFRLPVVPGERLLLCSDGINGMVDDTAIADTLGSVEDPADAAARLVELALSSGGRDNATAVVVDVVGWEPA